MRTTRPRNATLPSFPSSVLLVAALVGLGCAMGTGIGATRVPGRDADRRLAANVLATGEPSPGSLQTLHRTALLERYRSDPAGALGELHDGLARVRTSSELLRERLFALCELSFHLGRRRADRSWFLASAVYGHAFLTESASAPAETLALDARTRVAADLYNRGLAEGLSADGRIRIEGRVHALPFGSLTLELGEAGLSWGSFQLVDFVPAAELRTIGITNRYRQAGLGAALAAGVKPGASTGADALRISPRARVPSTLVMHVESPVASLVAGDVRGRLEVQPADLSRTILIEGREIPLEVETTAALALALDGVDAARLGRESFLSGRFIGYDLERSPDQLAMLFPYRPGRIPVVFVHGTNSSPFTWAELLNELMNDPLLADQLQYWFFFYPTGNPIGFSGGVLSESLRGITQELDPDGSDPALQRMVVIGHSQGGLLTKLAVVDTGTKLWDVVFDKAPDELAVGPETRAILARSLIFEPVQSVKRVVLIATPHGGSFLTRNPLAGLVRRLVSLPGAVTERLTDVIVQDPDAIALDGLERMPTSLDNMTPGDPFLERLKTIPVAEGVAVHSIVAVQKEGPPEALSDGVVEYTSARISQGTELVVRSGHSAHRQAEAIQEIRRILRQHLAESGGSPR